MESYPLYKLMSILSSVHHIRSISFVITSHCCNYGHKKKGCLTEFSDTQCSILSSLISKSFGFLEKNLAIPDLLSKNVSLKDLNGHQLAHKEIAKDIRFFIQNGHEGHYLIDHNISADD